jgi:hypothetical protein
MRPAPILTPSPSTPLCRPPPTQPQSEDEAKLAKYEAEAAAAGQAMEDMRRLLESEQQ